MKRWELDSEDGLSEGYGINESPTGEFVLYSDVAPLVEALRMAVRQNSHDMLMTGEEIRRCVTALTTIDAQERGV